MGHLNIQHLALPIEQLCVSEFIDGGIDMSPENVQVSIQYHVRFLAHQATLSLHLPTHTLQDRIIAEWPTTWWDHVKQRLGWKYRTTKVRLAEKLVVPQIPQPLNRYGSVRRIVSVNGALLK